MASLKSLKHILHSIQLIYLCWVVKLKHSPNEKEPSSNTIKPSELSQKYNVYSLEQTNTERKKIKPVDHYNSLKWFKTVNFWGSTEYFRSKLQRSLER